MESIGHSGPSARHKAWLNATTNALSFLRSYRRIVGGQKRYMQGNGDRVFNWYSTYHATNRIGKYSKGAGSVNSPFFVDASDGQLLADNGLERSSFQCPKRVQHIYSSQGSGGLGSMPSKVACNESGRYPPTVAANSATGCGNPRKSRRNSAPITFAGAIFMPAA